MTTASSNSSYMHDCNVVGLSHLNCIGDDGDRSHQREDSSVASFDSFQSNFEILAIKKVLAEGWLHKKGSGQDMLSSTEWKSRWAKLSVRHFALNYMLIYFNHILHILYPVSKNERP